MTPTRENTLIIIPARLAATRLPNKMLADIQGIPMIVRVWQQAQKSNAGEVIVACCGSEIKTVIEEAGGIAIETNPNLPSGSDRILEALQTYDPNQKYQYIINLQGDLPTIDPNLISQSLSPLMDQDVDIASLCSPITELQDIQNPNVVKVATGEWTSKNNSPTARAIYFSRLPIPANAKKHYHHIGIYAYKRKALENFVQLAPSYLETTEKLEQLRALENGMRIDMTLVNTVPQSVDTAEDLEFIRKILSPS